MAKPALKAPGLERGKIAPITITSAASGSVGAQALGGRIVGAGRGVTETASGVPEFTGWAGADAIVGGVKAGVRDDGIAGISAARSGAERLHPTASTITSSSVPR